MAKPRKPRSPRESARVRHLVALDAAGVMRRLASRQHEMVALFSRHRSREPLLEPLHSLFPSIGFGDLSKLEPHEQRAAQAFHAVLEELRWYLRYTEDMPGTVRTTLSAHLVQLETVHRALRETIGAPEDDGHPVVPATVSRR